MTRYLVEEVVTPGYSIDRGVYDNQRMPSIGQWKSSYEGIEENNIKIREVPL